jgi:hypothetical protein
LRKTDATSVAFGVARVTARKPEIEQIRARRRTASRRQNADKKAKRQGDQELTLPRADAHGHRTISAEVVKGTAAK